MKKGMIKILAWATLALLCYFLTPDQFNPLLKQEDVYVQINDKKPKLEDHRFKYELTGYNEKGEKKEVVFTTSTELSQGTYLKVLAKGSYTAEWTKLKPDEVPKNIKW
ncbi:YxeA family protein [Baia soyae]|uniref:Uncharacterized protein (TIGR01655 family) n=1 Tax=Baia soyae TaxID=1544746 RepID=A0A4R2S052_9BACL|nr:YxeA family protein [Baia soyae]TCP70727.1 uncharacterized protein (TIGR01655 family) [Baia soyae]